MFFLRFFVFLFIIRIYLRIFSYFLCIFREISILFAAFRYFLLFFRQETQLKAGFQVELRLLQVFQNLLL